MTNTDGSHDGDTKVIGSIRLPTEMVDELDAVIARANASEPHRPLTRNGAIRAALARYIADANRKR